MKRRKFSPTMSLVLAIFAASLIFASSALATGQTEVVLYSFGASGSSDGQNPFAGLIADKAGNFYGTTQSGGSFGGGTVFQLSPPLTKGGAWTETVLYSFGAGGKYDGGGP